ncbi:MAG: hypothetical protein HY318_01205 [Armatimonadetes bacterium]|nr:hypothetical protein [Armatimonadota bacterium]
MKRLLHFAWLAFVAFIVCRTASAGTVYGPSGLILNPSAYVPDAGSASIGASTFTVDLPGADKRWMSSTIDFGVGGKAEAGLTYLRRSGGGSQSGFGGFGKYQFQHESASGPAIAVGIDFIGGSLKTTQGYLTATKRLSPADALNPFTLTAGVIHVQDRDGITRHDDDVFGGFNLGIAPRLNLVTEWRSRTAGNPKNGSGAMLMYGGGKYGLAVGFVNNGASQSHEFFIGAGFNVSTLD